MLLFDNFVLLLNRYMWACVRKFLCQWLLDRTEVDAYKILMLLLHFDDSNELLHHTSFFEARYLLQWIESV